VQSGTDAVSVIAPSGCSKSWRFRRSATSCRSRLLSRRRSRSGNSRTEDLRLKIQD
jgi:hypothetical protein